MADLTIEDALKSQENMIAYIIQEVVHELRELWLQETEEETKEIMYGTGKGEPTGILRMGKHGK